MDAQSCYEQNRKLLNQYRWWRELNAPLSPFSELFGEDWKRSEPSKTETNTRPFFQDLSKPLLLESEFNEYNLRYVLDNVRRSEDYGDDNHVYLWYASVKELGELLTVINIEPLLQDEKPFFLIGKKSLEENYPYDFKTRVGVDYSAMPAQPLRLEEIKRLILDRPQRGYSGNIFMADVLDYHPNLLTMARFGGVGFSWIYSHFLKGRTVGEAEQEMRASLSGYLEVELCEMFMEFNPENPVPKPKWSDFWRQLEGIFQDMRPSIGDWHRAFFLAYSRALRRSENSRIVPAIRVTNHYKGPKLLYKDNLSLFETYSYRKEIEITRNPLKSLGSMLASEIGESKNRKFHQPWIMQIVSKGNAQMKAQIENYGPGKFRFPSELNENVKAVRFEDLKLKPEATLRAVSAFLDIPFSETMLQTTANGVLVGMNPTDVKKGEVVGFDSTPALNDHLEVLDPFDIYRLEIVYREEMEAYGYKPSYYTDGKVYTVEEVLKLFEKPFKVETFYYTRKQRHEALEARKTMMENLRYCLTHRFDYTEDGKKVVPVPVLEPFTEDIK